MNKDFLEAILIIFGILILIKILGKYRECIIFGSPLEKKLMIVFSVFYIPIYLWNNIETLFDKIFFFVTCITLFVGIALIVLKLYFPAFLQNFT